MTTAWGGGGAGAGPPEAMRVPLNETLLQSRNQNRSTVIGRHGMVCTSQPLATLAGVDALKAGGTAIDAAVCANAMLCVTEPMSCGPGGDLFAIVWSEQDRRLYGLNASGRSPYAWSLDAAAAEGIDRIPSQGPLAWSVPGCVSGWGALLDRFGALGMARVLQPAIDTAREGFAVSPVIARSWPFPSKFESLGRVFAPGGKPPDFGDIFANPDMAATFEQVASGGPKAFYEGSIAERIVAFSEKVGGKFAMRDFADHEVTWVDPVSASYRGFDIWEIPPNGQGIATLQIMNMLEQFDIASLTPNSADHLHLFLEAKKLAFEDRAVYYADMEKADVPLEWLISKDYARERAKRIDPRKANNTVKPGTLDGSTDTVYLCAADRHGNMISLIQSTYAGWGSHMAPDGLGFTLQNRGAAFSLDPNHRNRLEPHKRPFHTIIPAFVTKQGRPVMAFGVMGGAFQPQGQSQVLMNMIDFGYSVQQAGEQPRIGHNGSSDPGGGKMEEGGVVVFERFIPDRIRQALADMGHNTRPGDGEFGGYQAVWREDDPLRYFGGSDPRKDGCAIGY